MESTSSKSNAGAGLVEEDHFASIRRRNNTIIIVFFSLIILLGIIIGAIVISLLQKQYAKSGFNIYSNPVTKAYCSGTIYPPGCLDSLDSIVKSSKTDPNQLLSLSLEIAVKELNRTATLISNSTDSQTESAFRNCSSLVEESLIQLSEALAIFRVNPDVEKQNDEQISNMTKNIMAAEGDLRSCHDDLMKNGSTAVGEVRRRVYQAMMLVSDSVDFLQHSESVFLESRESVGAFNIISNFRNQETLFNVCMYGSQYLLLISLFCALFCIRRR